MEHPPEKLYPAFVLFFSLSRNDQLVMCKKQRGEEQQGIKAS